MNDDFDPYPDRPLRKGTMPEVDRHVLEGRTSSRTILVSTLAFFGTLFTLGWFALTNYGAGDTTVPAALHTVHMADDSRVAGDGAAGMAAEDAMAYESMIADRSEDDLAIPGEPHDFTFGAPTAELLPEPDQERQDGDSMPFGQPMVDWFAEEFGGWGEDAE